MTNGSDGFARGRLWDLPPLILHPFGQGLEAATILHSAKLALELHGLAVPDDAAEDAREVLLRARCGEFRMLCLVGKDLMRWIRQCMDFVSRDAALAQAGFREQSFADLLVNRTPATVAERFESWGVIDYRRILSRGIGLVAVFPSPPPYEVVSAEFLADYYSYADGLFACHQTVAPFTPLPLESFGVSLYTSDEYLSTLGGGIGEEQSGG